MWGLSGKGDRYEGSLGLQHLSVLGTQLAVPVGRAAQTCIRAVAPKRSHFLPVTWEAPEPVTGSTELQLLSVPVAIT